MMSEVCPASVIGKQEGISYWSRCIREIGGTLDFHINWLLEDYETHDCILHIQAV